MPIVIDSSVATCWIMPDEKSDAAESAFDMAEERGAIVPAIFWYEFHNILLVNERRGRVSTSEVFDAAKEIGRLPIDVIALQDYEPPLALARWHGLTFYDASYLDIAIKRQTSLATLDRRLAKAARQEGIRVITDA